MKINTSLNPTKICSNTKHSLARGLEEWHPENIFSRQINFQCVVFFGYIAPVCHFLLCVV